LIPSSSASFLDGELLTYSYYSTEDSNCLLNCPVNILNLYKIVEKKSFFIAYYLKLLDLSTCKIY